MIKSILFSISLVLSLAYTGLAQFEGIIKFEEHEQGRITKYAFYVQGENVRIEEYDERGRVVGVDLVDLHTERSVALNTERRIYVNITSLKPLPFVSLKKVEQIGAEKIVGLDCRELTLIDKTSGAKAVYWMTDGDYAFFGPLLKALNSDDPISLYLLQAGISTGQFAVKSTYFNPDGSVGLKLVTTSVTPKQLKSSLFEIPRGYTEFNN